jgi:hypothetical protein
VVVAKTDPHDVADTDREVRHGRTCAWRPPTCVQVGHMNCEPQVGHHRDLTLNANSPAMKPKRATPTNAPADR